MPLHQLTEEELRSLAKGRVEAMERWLRRLVHEFLEREYGPSYFDATDASGHVIKNDVRRKAAALQAREPRRYARLIDATLLNEVVDIVTNYRRWPLFKIALEEAFPEGHVVAKALLRRVVAVRNPLYHSNPITLRQAEQACCYANDVIDAMKSYYVSRGQDTVYNVSTFVRIRDSLGHIIEKEELGENQDGLGVYQLDADGKYDLRPGDHLTIEVEVDPVFEAGTYSVLWSWGRHSVGATNKLVIKLAEADVHEFYRVRVKVRSDKSWHRYGDYDAGVMLEYRVLPPL